MVLTCGAWLEVVESGRKELLTVEDWAEIRRLHRAEGLSINEIVRRTGVARNTVRTALRSVVPPVYRRQGPGSMVDAVEPEIRRLLMGPPGTGKTHLSIGLGIRACQAGHRVAFATAAEWVARLGEAHHQGRLHGELTRLGRIPLLVIDEVGYIPFDGEAANLFFQLISARYERASVIVASNKPFGRWGETFGDATVAAAMIDRLVHHAEVINLKGDSYRLKDRDLGRVTPTTTHRDHDPSRGVNFRPPKGGSIFGRR